MQARQEAREPRESQAPRVSQATQVMRSCLPSRHRKLHKVARSRAACPTCAMWIRSAKENVILQARQEAREPRESQAPRVSQATQVRVSPVYSACAFEHA